MQELLAKIIEMDANARRIKQAAEQDKLNSEAEIEELRQKIYDDYIKRAKERVEKNIAVDRQLAQEEYDAYKEQAERIKTGLNESYKQNKDRWVCDIVNNVISG